MALGMGEMLGFKFVENFNHPYVSQSITDFWRRWHISLSSWVREYIFFPLEFQRRSVTILRQQTNIIAAFLVMGLWHGLTPNFILWALVHGLALALEMSFLGKALKRIWRPLRHVYTLAVVLLGWVFFRSNSLPYAFKFLQRLVGSGGDIIPQWFDKTRPLPIIDNSVWLAFGAGILFSLPVAPYIRKVLQERITHPGWRLFGQIVYDLLLMALFFLSVMAVTSAGFVGNIYGRF
jgi:alginate O-acetyltransferase complex protein AlgI